MIMIPFKMDEGWARYIFMHSTIYELDRNDMITGPFKKIIYMAMHVSWIKQTNIDLSMKKRYGLIWTKTLGRIV
jgi:hypothetical protein